MAHLRYILFGFVLTLWACANIVAPTGGDKDETPPKLKTEASTENYQTNFEKQDLKFVFDEFIELKDVFKQVVVSPPLEKQWKLSKKLKTVTFEFDEDEVLRPDATYTINFGDAIVDYTQGNVVPDFRFVFSTGDAIDSMTVSGKVVDALTNKPADKVLLLLYDDLADSVVRKDRPFYFGKTAKDGTYTIQNVKQDTFKVFAIKDEGLPYLFDQVQELIGFPDSFIVLNQPNETLPDIGIFKEVPPLQLIPPNSKNYGKINLVFNTSPIDVEVTFDNVGQTVFQEMVKDTIRFWYDYNDTLAWNIYLQEGEAFRDTFKVLTPSKNTFTNSAKFKREEGKASDNIRANPTKPLRLTFNHPLKSIDTSLVYLLEDTIYSRVVPDLAVEGRELIINHSWRAGMPYQLRMLPGALSDIYGLQSLDSIEQKYQIMERKDFGDIQLQVTDLDTSKQYVINLYFKSSANLVEKNIVKGENSFSKSFKTVPEGQYIVEVVTDNNRNGRWDTGNYNRKAQPEPIFTKSLEKLRANWEVNATVSILPTASPAQNIPPEGE